MASTKRRRSIDIDCIYIEALKNIASARSDITATGVASKVFVGDLPHLSIPGRSQKHKGVSMTEAMWLSIRSRAEKVGKPTRVVAHELLNGREPHLTKREIDFGLNRAREREESRAGGKPEEATRRVVTKRVRAEAEEHFGQFVGAMASWSPINGRHASKVKAAANEKMPTESPKEDTSIIVATPQNDAQKKRKKLSRGEPLGAEDKNENVAKEANPDEEVYGGYFQF